MVEGLEGGRWSLICKVHHCMVDGIAGVGLLTIVLDTERAERHGSPVPWVPRRAPPAGARVFDAWGGLVADTAGLVRRTAAGIARPRATAAAMGSTAAGAVRLLVRLAPTRSLSIEGPIGPHRAWSHSSARLDRVTEVRRAFGGTVNDVVLAAVAGGYRELLLSRGDDVDRAALRTLVPVSTRHTDAAGVPDNRLAAILYDLPVGVADPVERLAHVHEEMAALKSAHLVEAGEAAVSLADLMPPMVLGDATRCAVRAMRLVGQPSLNTVTTNVPGPQVPLYCLGSEMLEYLPFVPIAHGLRVGTAIISYNGSLAFGVTGDGETVPDVDVLASAAAACVDELYERALERDDRRSE